MRSLLWWETGWIRRQLRTLTTMCACVHGLFKLDPETNISHFATNEVVSPFLEQALAQESAPPEASASQIFWGRRSDGQKSHSDSSYWTWRSCARSWFRDFGTQHRTMFVREGSGARKLFKSLERYLEIPEDWEKSPGENDEEDRRQRMERKFIMI